MQLVTCHLRHAAQDALLSEISGPWALTYPSAELRQFSPSGLFRIELRAEHFLCSGSLCGTRELADSKSRGLGAVCFLTCWACVAGYAHARHLEALRTSWLESPSFSQLAQGTSDTSEGALQFFPWAYKEVTCYPRRAGKDTLLWALTYPRAGLRQLLRVHHSALCVFHACS